MCRFGLPVKSAPRKTHWAHGTHRTEAKKGAACDLRQPAFGSHIWSPCLLEMVSFIPPKNIWRKTMISFGHISFQFVTDTSEPVCVCVPIYFYNASEWQIYIYSVYIYMYIYIYIYIYAVNICYIYIYIMNKLVSRFCSELLNHQS